MDTEIFLEKNMFWKLSPEAICQNFNTNAQQGLSSEEAQLRLEKYGKNILPEPKKLSLWGLFFHQFSSVLIWILIVAGLIAGILGEWVDAFAIIAIVILNAFLGFIQEYKAERSLAALRTFAIPQSKVIRDNHVHMLASSEIVPGDLVIIEAGNKIPADGRLIYASQLTTQEAAFTGESIAIHKKPEAIPIEDLFIADRKNMLFMGTIAVSGKGRMIVTGTGQRTEIGKIAALLSAAKKEKTPLQNRLEALGRKLVWICLATIAFVFILGIFRGNSFIDMLLTALSLAVAAVPEGLPAIVTISLALGVKKMAKRHALIRRLPTVETLGCATIICTDKTGTLTQNEMSVKKVWVSQSFIDVTGIGYSVEGKFLKEGKEIKPIEIEELIFLFKIGVLCNDATLSQQQGKWQITGDPTEGALLVAAGKAGLFKRELEKAAPLLGEIPFDSERKRMSILRENGNGAILYVKGAPDVLITRSETILINGKKIPFSEELKQTVQKANAQYAQEALRVLAFAYQEVTKKDSLNESLEENLTFVGLIAMIDPPRLEAKEAIEKCKKAGIKTIMITGDHKDTALAIAKELGILDQKERAIDGNELSRMDDETLKQKVQEFTVYARVATDHKLRIIKAWKSHKQVVAMTGDGVNDAPSIKEANIGIAMGITGTDVAKEASDMVILDDNFASIVNAVEEGRGIYDNILKFVTFLLSSNIAEIFVVFVSMLLGFRDALGNPFIALTAVQLLWINLVTDGLPAIALCLDPIDPYAMQKPPRKVSEPILSMRLSLHLLTISIVVAIGTLIACYIGLQKSAIQGHSMAFTTLVVLEIVVAQTIRASYNMKFFSNPWMIYALLSSLILQIFVVYLPPLQVIFGTNPLNLNDWLIIIAIALGTWWINLGFNQLFKPNLLLKSHLNGPTLGN